MKMPPRFDWAAFFIGGLRLLIVNLRPLVGLRLNGGLRP